MVDVSNGIEADTALQKKACVDQQGHDGRYEDLQPSNGLEGL